VLSGGNSQTSFQFAGIDQEANPLKWLISETEIALSAHKAKDQNLKRRKFRRDDIGSQRRRRSFAIF
jgi:hypothetical protein